MRRRLGRGRGGPGLLGTVARTAVIAGTASAVAGRVDAAQQTAAQEQLRQTQLQAQIDAQVDARMAGTQPAPTPASAPARPSVDELHAQLTKLGELRQAGLLTDAEFAEQKARLLA